MKIAIVSLNLRRGGFEKIIALLACEFLRLGHKLEVVPIHGPIEYKEIFQKEAITPHPLFDGAPPYFWTSLPQMAAKLRERIAGFDPDVTLVFGAQAQILARLAGVPNAVFGAQNTSALHWKGLRPGFALLRALERWAIAKPGLLVVACSQSVAQSYQSRFGLAPDAIKVIFNSTNLDDYKVEQKVMPTQDGLVRIICVGTLYYQKNFEMALRAFRRLLDRNVRAKLRIAGDGPDRRNLEALATKLGIDGDVEFLGKRQDVPDLMKQSDLFWITSRYEGFGIVIAEAMAARLPVIATAVPGIVDVVSDSIDGYLVPIDNDEEFVNATISVLTNDAVRRYMTDNAFKKALTEFNPEGMARQYEDLFTQMSQAKMPQKDLVAA